MQSTLILSLLLAFLSSFLIAYFQYFFKVKKKLRVTVILFVLKGLSLFLLILLFINPKINQTIITNIKPVISLLVDNSNSIAYFKEEKSVKDLVNLFTNDKELSNKFDIQKFSFGNQLNVLDSLTFIDNQTHISEAILNVNELQKDNISPVIFITDGNETIGNDYEFIKINQPIYPIVIGDTTTYVDLKISQLNVNKYSFIKNKFPVEAILNYEGDKNITTQFSILHKGKTVFRKNVQFSDIKKSVIVNTNLESTKEGLQFYTATLSKIENEKNIKNNSKSFSVEVINQQTKVLLLTSILHPDLGAFKKAIESNNQRTVDIVSINNFKSKITDYQLIILYQPNNKFNNVINQIKQQNYNYFLITGAKTDWNFINQKQLGFRKNVIEQTENYSAIFNDNYLTFLQEDIGFNNYPPLKDKYGELSLSKEHQTILYQNINGLQTEQPLLTTLDLNNQKIGILLGEGIWRWRANSFLNTNSFKDFDKLIGNLVQFLASNKKRNRLEIDAPSIYPANSTVSISAFYTDKNYQFDPRASLEITIFNQDNKVITKVPFSMIKNSYKTEIENLGSGNYSYKVEVLGQNIFKNGRFKITDYNIEQQFTNANVSKLEKLAANTQGKLFYKSDFESIKKELLENESFYTLQKATKKEQNLIDWKWLLFFVTTLFTLEWFLRKYFGKI